MFTLPTARNVTIIYGDGTEGNIANVSGVYLEFSASPLEGDHVELINNFAYNSTNSTDVLVINWSSSSNQPTGRKLIYDLGTVYEIGTNSESSLVETHATSYVQGRKSAHFYYVSAINTWLSRLDSY